MRRKLNEREIMQLNIFHQCEGQSYIESYLQNINYRKNALWSRFASAVATIRRSFGERMAFLSLKEENSGVHSDGSPLH